jgi:hypothetical protein
VSNLAVLFKYDEIPEQIIEQSVLGKVDTLGTYQGYAKHATD